MRHQARQRYHRVTDISAGFAGGKAATNLVRELKRNAGDED